MIYNVANPKLVVILIANLFEMIDRFTVNSPKFITFVSNNSLILIFDIDMISIDDKLSNKSKHLTDA